VENVLVGADYVVQGLRRALGGEEWLNNAPGLLKRLISENLWQRRIDEVTGEVVEFERFVDFVTTKPLEGLGSTISTLKRVCGGDVEATDLLDQALQQADGGDHRSEEYRTTVNNINSDTVDRPAGTSRAAALRKLRRDARELHDQVIAGELSPHAAMVQAGFRRPTLTIPLDPTGAAGAIRRNCDQDFISQLIELLSEAAHE
jgi:hypothetical protein